MRDCLGIYRHCSPSLSCGVYTGFPYLSSKCVVVEANHFQRKKVIIIKHYKTEEEFFTECCSFASDVFKFVESISGDNRWFFHECYLDNSGRNHTVIFKSYDLPEYQNFILSVVVRKQNDKYVFTVLKQVTELV